MKRILILLVLVCAVGAIFADTDELRASDYMDHLSEDYEEASEINKESLQIFSKILEFLTPESGFVGIGPEINAYTRSRAAFGGIFVLGFDFKLSAPAALKLAESSDDLELAESADPETDSEGASATNAGSFRVHQFAGGIRTGFFNDAKTVNTWDMHFFFRYSLSFDMLRWPGVMDGPFVQAELGIAIPAEYNVSFPAFSGTAAAGWRFNLPENFYAEPMVRFGYPLTWAFSATAGYRFPIVTDPQQRAANQEQRAINREQRALERQQRALERQQSTESGVEFADNETDVKEGSNE